MSKPQKERVESIVRLRKAGKNYKEIAMQFGMTQVRTPQQKSLSEAADSVGCAGVKIRQLEALCRVRQRAGDEGGGALRAGSVRGSD